MHMIYLMIYGIVFSKEVYVIIFSIKFLFMKLSIKTFAIVCSAVIMYACNSGDKSTTATSSDSVGSDQPAAMDTSHITDTSHTMASSAASSPEQDFLNYAIPANAKEIIWLKAGIAHGDLKDIKAHASMMLKDHTKLGATVKDFLSKKPAYTMPSLTDTVNTVNITDKTGADWEKAWSDKMVDDHKDLLDKLKKAQDDVKDPDLKKIITSTIPVIESHLAMAKTIKDKIK